MVLGILSIYPIFYLLKATVASESFGHSLQFRCFQKASGQESLDRGAGCTCARRGWLGAGSYSGLVLRNFIQLTI